MLVNPIIFATGSTPLSDHWLPDLASPILSRTAQGTTSIDETYTSVADMDVLIMNEEIIDALLSSPTPISTVTTTGIPLQTNTQQVTTADQQYRMASCTFVFAHLAVGDIVTFTNKHGCQYGSRAHCIWPVSNRSTSMLSPQWFETVVDNTAHQTYQFTAPTDGRYLALALQSKSGGSSTLSASITGTTDNYYTKSNDAFVKFAIGTYDLSEGDTITMETANSSYYVSKLYGVWAI